MPFELEIVLRLLLAAVLGAIIGFQREKAHKAAGMRTLTLITAGSALFTAVSVYGFPGDAARIASGIVAGIGFIGAGTIIRREGGEAAIEGLTTAATIWVAAGVGMAAGAGMYIGAVVATALLMAILLLPHFK